MLNDKLQQADVAGDLNRFLYTICGDRLKKPISTFAAENAGTMRLENKEGIKFSSVMELRHDHAVSVRIDEDNVYYNTFVVSASFLTEEDTEDDAEQMRISSCLRFSPEIQEGYQFDARNVALEPKLLFSKSLSRNGSVIGKMYIMLHEGSSAIIRISHLTI